MAAIMMIAGRILNTSAISLLDSAVRRISSFTKACGLRWNSFSNLVILGWFVKYNPAPIAVKKRPATKSGQIKAFAITVLPQYQKPIAAIIVMTLNIQTILAEKTSALAQSVLSLRTSIFRLFFILQ